MTIFNFFLVILFAAAPSLTSHPFLLSLYWRLWGCGFSIMKGLKRGLDYSLTNMHKRDSRNGCEVRLGGVANRINFG